MFIKVFLTIIFLVIMVGVGIYSNKQARSVDGFVLGGRSVGPWLTAFAYGTSYFSAVVFVGYAGQFGWKYGLSSAWIGIGNAVIGSLLAWLLLGRRTKLMTQHIESRTMPDFFGTRSAPRTGFHHRLRIPYSLHRRRLQRYFAPLRTGFQHTL